jgi:hypothetical protein
VLGTLLVVVAALSQVVTAGLAIRMALREEPRGVRLAMLFVALAVASLGATAWTAVRTSDRVAGTTTRIDLNTAPREPRASLRVAKREVVTMGIDQIVRVSIGIENTGDRLATGVSHVQMVSFVLSPYGEEETFRLLRAELQSAGDESLTVAPAGRLSFTIEGPRLLASDFLPRGSDPPQVVRDGRPLLVAGIIRYRSDDSSEATTEYCFYAMNPNVLVECSATGSPRSTAPRT